MTAPMTHACPVDLIELARRLADASGPVIRSYFRQPIQVDGKADASPVTAAEVRTAMAKALRDGHTHFPPRKPRHQSPLK